MARREPDTDDDAPWLSSVEAERDATTFVPRRRFIAGVAIFLALLAIIVGGLYWVTARARQGGSSGTAVTNPEDAPLIAADPGPYKVAPGPDDPDGLNVEGKGDTIYNVGEGGEVNGALDPGALPEEPLPRPGTSEPQDLLPPAADGASSTVVIPPAGTRPAAPIAPAVPVTVKPLPKPVSVDPAAPAAKPAKPATGGVALQLGAFSTSTAANSVWADYSKRFKYLSGLGKAVQPVERNGTTLYRLRAVGVADRATAADLCARLKIAGVECVVAQ